MAGKAKSAPRRRSLRSQKRQTTLPFSPVPSSSPTKDKDNQAVYDRLTDVPDDIGGERPAESDQTPSEHRDTLPTPEPSSQLRHSPEAPSPTTVGLVHYDSDEDDFIVSSSKRRRITSPLPRRSSLTATPTRRSSRLQTRPESPSQGSTLPRATQRLAAARVPSPPRPSGISDIGSAETSEDEDPVMASRPTVRKRRGGQKTDVFVVGDDNDYNSTTNNNNQNIQLISSSEEERPRKASKPKQRKPTSDDFVVDDDEIEYASAIDDVDRHHHLLSSKSRRASRHQKAPRTSHSRTEAEQRELDEDLRDLQDSDRDVNAGKSRTRGGPVTTQRDKTRQHLDLLRRRRAGEKVPRAEDWDLDGDEEAEEEGVDIDFIDQDRHDVWDRGSSVGTEAEVERVEEEEEDDFIVEDSTGRLGRPHPEIPLQFTSFASAKPRELFPHIVEWLVKNKIAPAFRRDDDVYNIAFDRVDDQVKAQAGSRLISSAWNSTFKTAILARPGIEVTALPGLDEDNIRTCDACNRANHPARYEFIFSGQAYSKKTLEPIDISDDEDGDDDSASRDEAGHVLAPQHQRFYLGRFCAANAEMGHKLTHWKYHLNESVLAYLEDQRVLSAEAILAREKMNKKKREKEAEAIVDAMEQSGMIAQLWKDFQNDLDDARLGMEDYDRKGGRSKGRIGAIRSIGVDGTIREWSGDRYKETRRLGSDSEGD